MTRLAYAELMLKRINVGSLFRAVTVPGAETVAQCKRCGGCATRSIDRRHITRVELRLVAHEPGCTTGLELAARFAAEGVQP